MLWVQVDVVVSEWMGYALLFETMLDSVRRRVLLRCNACACCGDAADQLGWQAWNTFQGILTRGRTPTPAELRSSRRATAG